MQTTNLPAISLFRQQWAYEGDDPALMLFTAALHAEAIDIAPSSRVLEIGCAEADWLSLAHAADPTLDLYGIDWRRCDRPGTVVQDNVLAYDYPHGSFDVIVSLSTIEHIGLGQYEHDPIHPLGDWRAVARAYEWLKPGGRFYLDVPYRPEGFEIRGTEYRMYNDQALHDLLLPSTGPRRPWRYCWTGYAPRTNPGTFVDRPTQTHSDHGFDVYVALWLEKPA